jgi:hypothetical protein
MSTDHKVNYRLAEARHNARLAEFRAAGNLTSLEDEIALARTLIEDRLNSAASPAERAGALTMIRDLLAVLGNLCKAHHIRQQQDGELLAKPALEQLGRVMVDIVADELSPIEGWEEIVSRIADRLATAIAGANNAQ